MKGGKKDMVKIAPSILQADFAKMGDVIKDLENANCDIIHLDVMDGTFVNAITFGPKMVRDIRKVTTLPLDVHLMIVNPEKHIEKFANAGADIITIHQEAVDNLEECLNTIKSKGVKSSVSIKPATPVAAILDVLPIVDMVLVMTVEPGKGGQSLIEETLDKVKELKRLREENHYSYDIQVDGGIKANTKDKAISAGVDILVVGSAITSSSDYTKAIKELKGE